MGTPLLVPAVAATGSIDSEIDITAVAGAAGNVTINIIAGGTAGSETAVQVGSVITVSIEDGVSTQNQIRTALLALAGVFQTITVVNGSTPWTLGIGTDTVTLTGGEDAYFNPSTGEITMTVLPGSAGNNISVEITDGAVAAGSEIATRVGDITVQIKDGEITEAQIRTALLTVAGTFLSVVVANPTLVWTIGQEQTP